MALIVFLESIILSQVAAHHQSMRTSGGFGLPLPVRPLALIIPGIDAELRGDGGGEDGGEEGR